MVPAKYKLDLCHAITAQGVCELGDKGEDVQRRGCGAHVPQGWLCLLPQQPAAVWPPGQGHPWRWQQGWPLSGDTLCLKTIVRVKRRLSVDLPASHPSLLRQSFRISGDDARAADALIPYEANLLWGLDGTHTSIDSNPGRYLTALVQQLAIIAVCLF